MAERTRLSNLDDPISVMAKQRIVRLSAELEVMLEKQQDGDVCVAMLYKLRDNAADSLAKLPFLNLDDPQDLVKAKVLQNEVKRYDEWIGWMREFIQQGKLYDRELTDADREEALELLCRTPEGQREAIALGLLTENPQDDV